jgi:KUP system potassium uptake protein
MLMTSVLLFIAMRDHLRWGLSLSAAIAGCFIVVDSAFLGANPAKIADGGYVPLALAGLVYGTMWILHSGRKAVTSAITAKFVPVDRFMADIAGKGVPRVPAAPGKERLGFRSLVIILFEEIANGRSND